MFFLFLPCFLRFYVFWAGPINVYPHRSLSSAVILMSFIKSCFLVSQRQYAQLQEFYHSYIRIVYESLLQEECKRCQWPVTGPRHVVTLVQRIEEWLSARVLKTVDQLNTTENYSMKLQSNKKYKSIRIIGEDGTVDNELSVFHFRLKICLFH